MSSFTERLLASFGISFVPVIMTGYSIVALGNSFYDLFMVWFFGFAVLTFFAFLYWSVLGSILWAIGQAFCMQFLGIPFGLDLLIGTLAGIYFPATFGLAYRSLRQTVYIPDGPKWTPKDELKDEPKEPEVKVITKVVERVKEVPRKLTRGELGRVINYWQQKFNEAPEGSREREEANGKIREYQDEYEAGKNEKGVIKR